MSAYVVQLKKVIIAVLLLGLSTAGVLVSPAQAATTRHVTIHYYRNSLSQYGTAENGFCETDPCGVYDGWNIWAWQTGVPGLDGQILFDSTDKFGTKATFEVGNAVSSFGFLVRIGTNWAWAKDDISTDRSIQVKPTGDTEVWIKQGDPLVYTANPNDRVLRIHYSRADNKYAGWDIQSQEANAADDKAIAFTTLNDCFGRVAAIQVPEISQKTQDYVLRKGGNSPSLKSRVFTASLSDSKYTDVWLNANLFMGEDITVDEGAETYLDLAQQAKNPSGNLVVVHYSRPLDDYAGWTMTTLADGIKHKFTAVDPLFGRLGCAYVADLSATTSVIKMTNGSKVDLAFRENATGLGGQRTINVTGAVTEVWFKQGYAKISEKQQESDPAVKSSQRIGTVVTSLQSGKSAVLPMKTDAKLKVSWYVLTPANCKISAGKLVAKQRGKCKLDASQTGNAAFNLFTAQYKITIK